MSPSFSGCAGADAGPGSSQPPHCLQVLARHPTPGPTSLGPEQLLSPHQTPRLPQLQGRAAEDPSEQMWALRVGKLRRRARNPRL